MILFSIIHLKHCVRASTSLSLRVLTQIWYPFLRDFDFAQSPEKLNTPRESGHLPTNDTGHPDISHPPEMTFIISQTLRSGYLAENSRNRSAMKATKELSYGQAVEIGVVLGVTLILLQLVNLMVYVQTTPGAEIVFSSAYMKSGGFYVFQILGYFLYATVIYISLKKIRSKMFKKVLILIGSGILLELSFYLIMQASFEGAFLYSILDKVVAAAFALILYNYTTPEVKTLESYI